MQMFDRIAQIKSFLFPNSGVVFDRRFDTMVVRDFTPNEWMCILNEFAEDITEGSASIPSTSKVCALIVGRSPLKYFTS
jgi:hypothetical protein